MVSGRFAETARKEQEVPEGAGKVGFSSLHYSVLEAQGEAKCVARGACVCRGSCAMACVMARRGARAGGGVLRQALPRDAGRLLRCARHELAAAGSAARGAEPLPRWPYAG